MRVGAVGVWWGWREGVARCRLVLLSVVLSVVLVIVVVVVIVVVAVAVVVVVVVCVTLVGLVVLVGAVLCVDTGIDGPGAQARQTSRSRASRMSCSKLAISGASMQIFPGSLRILFLLCPI